VHLTPYSLQWLKQGTKLTVFKQALIAFFGWSINYSEVLCNVLHMDVCHLLLGKPWVLDNHVIHDGHANTYAFKHNGRSLALTPLPKYKLLKFKSRKGSEKSLFTSETRVERAFGGESL